jgi:carboxypeptidase T
VLSSVAERIFVALTVNVILMCSMLVLAFAQPDEPRDPPAPLYQVSLPAADRESRTALVRRGIAVDAVSKDTVTTIVSAAGLARLRELGLRPLEIGPLDFPPADAAYHNYDEMLAEIAGVAAAHPDIVAVSIAGYSLEGRIIPAVKISDQPGVDDPSEPAVLFMALTHAREHLTVEMALDVIRLFTNGYGNEPALTNLVDHREIWVLPSVNPDGGEFDVASDSYAYWRKNLRPNPDGSFGVDLNRNYGYRWGCCDGSSDWPGADTYRGPAAFSEPETQAVRDFVLAHGDIIAAISFHAYGELILYPYGYTYDSLPPDMDSADYQAFEALARRMADTNGYSPMQASNLYVTSGDVCDWLYGDRHVFAFTFEMYSATSNPGFYPPGQVIGRETRRNDAAVSYLTAMADNPRKVIGLGGDATPPSISITATVPGSLLPGESLVFSTSATDDIGVTQVSWQADGRLLALDKVPPFDLTWVAPRPGLHVLQATAYDAGGSSAPSNPITAMVTTRTLLPLVGHGR